MIFLATYIRVRIRRARARRRFAKRFPGTASRLKNWPHGECLVVAKAKIRDRLMFDGPAGTGKSEAFVGAIRERTKTFKEIFDTPSPAMMQAHKEAMDEFDEAAWSEEPDA